MRWGGALALCATITILGCAAPEPGFEDAPPSFLEQASQSLSPCPIEYGWDEEYPNYMCGPTGWLYSRCEGQTPALYVWNGWEWVAITIRGRVPVPCTRLPGERCINPGECWPVPRSDGTCQHVMQATCFYQEEI